MHAWYEFIEKLKAQMGQATINKWINSVKIVKFDACNLYLEAEDSFQLLWFQEHILKRAKHELLNSNNHPIRIHLKLKNISTETLTENKPEKKIAVELKPDQTNEHYSFHTFFEDKSNSLCYKFLSNLSSNVNSPFSLASFNPILIHGPSGSGKTHLLSALTKKLLSEGIHAFYVKAQTFTSHVVNSMRLGHIHDFRKTYREVDVLIIDDIHLLEGKNATQEEFFHTFNTLHSSNHQIIMSSIHPPRQLLNIEPRLISRFEWGILLELNLPDISVLDHILETKAKNYSLIFDKETKEYLLNTFPSPKDIEKALQAIILRIPQKEEFSETNLSMTKALLNDLISEQKKIELTPDVIIQVISTHFGIFPEDVLGKSQTKECTTPRQIAMYFCREKLKLPYKKIGDIFDRDHSTVITSVKCIEKSKSEKANLYFALLEIEKKLPS